MSERAIQFGPDRRLIGILSLPETLDPARPAILIPNTGVEHRVGPNRLHVHLCRAFADIGFASFRMDLSGFGDSGLPAAHGKVDAIADQQSALDELERLGIARRFIPIGLSSGGNDAHLLTRVEPRIVAAAYLDHYSYSTARYYLTFILQRVSEGRRFKNYVERKIQEISQSEKDKFRGDLITYFEQPSRAQFSEDVSGFIERRLPLFYLFTGESQNLYNYRDQLLDACPPLRAYDLRDLLYFPQSDHTFTHIQMRVALINELKKWLIERVLPNIPAS